MMVPRMSHGAFAAVLLSSLVVASHGQMYDDSDEVVMLSGSDFDEKVLEGKQVWVVEFFAPWCGHCKILAPHYKKAATDLKGDKVMVGAVDCDMHKDLAAKYGVEGFPTIKGFTPGGADPIPYKGARDLDGTSFVRGALGAGAGQAGRRGDWGLGLAS